MYNGSRERYYVLHGNEPSTSRGSINVDLKESLFLEHIISISYLCSKEYHDIHFLSIQLLSESIVKNIKKILFLSN